MKKRLSFILCIISCVLLMAGCDMSLTKQNKNFNKKTLSKEADTYIKTWFETDYKSQYEQLESAIEYYDSMKDSISEEEWKSYQEQRAEVVEQIKEYKEYTKQKKKYGDEYKKQVGKTEYTISSESATVTKTIQTNKGKKILYSVSFDEDGNKTEQKIEEYKTLGQKMGKAGLNTIMSMAIVFVVLIFISLIISCFKVIGVIQDRRNQKQTASVTMNPIPVEAPAEAENLVDDLELVAVITAAIAAASESESADGLVVRSIVRR